MAKPPTLTAEELVECLDLMIEGAIPDEQVAVFLTALRMTELDHSAEFIAAASQRVFQESKKIDTTKINSKEGYVDIVGTGGDGKNTFNVSTTAAMVAAGIGIDVCKHGGKASTSASGAGDLLASLGVVMSAVTNETTPEILEKSKFCFLFAPVFHPLMASLAPLRRKMGIPTIFNILGPLLNPVPLRARIVGVYSESLGQVFAEAIRLITQSSGIKGSRALVVWGEEGLDEISPAGRTKVWELKPDGDIVNFWISPADFGLPAHSLEHVASGTPLENAEVVKQLLSNKMKENDPILDYVLMNTAALAVIDGKAESWKDGVKLARDSIESGRAKTALQKFIDTTHSLRGSLDV